MLICFVSYSRSRAYVHRSRTYPPSQTASHLHPAYSMHAHYGKAQLRACLSVPDSSLRIAHISITYRRRRRRHTSESAPGRRRMRRLPFANHRPPVPFVSSETYLVDCCAAIPTGPSSRGGFWFLNGQRERRSPGTKPSPATGESVPARGRRGSVSTAAAAEADSNAKKERR
ncbi:hypothetical protein LX36DRAFT_15321 [Colletotrichum falcatum]|nr:hypothetical protein LX36DRAFT_15321 [Colletotrichum falcatum]